MHYKKHVFTLFILLCISHIAAFAQAEFFPNGKRKAETTHTQDYAYVTKWYENGNKLLEGALRYEKRVGTWRFWNEDGSPQFTMYYDSLSTDRIKASTLGVIVRIMTYSAGSKLESIENFSDGLPFVNSTYFPNGQLSEIVHHEDGVPIGGMKWYQNGNISEMFCYQKVYNSVLVASTGKEILKLIPKRLVYKSWFDNGKVSLDGQIDNKNEPVGTWREYDKFGNVLLSIEH
jgi:antitoxin component YwqK of YwqJK toxin-antitoxin module